MAIFQFPTSVSLDAGHVALRQLSGLWLDEVLTMVNDPLLSQLTGTTEVFTRAQIENWLATRPTQTDRCDWAILDNETGEFAGEIVLNEYLAERNSMNLRICLAGERWFDRGIGTAAIDAVLTYAFDGMQLAKVTLSVLIDNPRATRVYERLGFKPGRQYSEKGMRFQRMAITKLDFVGAMAGRLMGESLNLGKWAFGFDSGKRRAGQCDHTNRRITLSRHMSNLHSVDQSRQVMFHEIAHALAGVKHGHDAQWLRIATDLGYRNEKISARLVDQEHARWLGTCPNGHEYFRYKKPTRTASCAKCSKKFDPAFLIRWAERD